MYKELFPWKLGRSSKGTTCLQLSVRAPTSAPSPADVQCCPVAPGQHACAAASLLSGSSCHTRLYSLPSTGRSHSSSACGRCHDPSSPLYLLLFCHVDFSHPELLRSCSCWHLLPFLAWSPVCRNGLSGRNCRTGGAEHPGEGAMQSSVGLEAQKSLHAGLGTAFSKTKSGMLL